MPTITWLSDKVGLTDGGNFVLIGPFFDPTGTEAEGRVGINELPIVLTKEMLLAGIDKKLEISQT